MAILFEKIFPVFIVLTLGMLLRKKNIVSVPVMAEVKNLLINLALPSILFLSFSHAELEARYILLFVIMFAVCTACYIVGLLLKKFIPSTFHSFFTPWFVTGYEFGMIGIALFTSIWGIENLSVFMIIGLAHEFFAWFVCIPYVQYKLKGSVNIGAAIKDFFSSPVMISILAGILANVTGLYDWASGILIGSAIFNAMDILAALGTPLILLIVGHSMVFEKMKLSKAISYTVMRAVCIGGFGLIALQIIHATFTGLDPMFDIAFYTFLVLPPSYMLPVLTQDPEEKKFFSQITVYYTALSFIVYALVVALIQG